MNKTEIVVDAHARTGLTGSKLRDAVAKTHPKVIIPKSYFYAPKLNAICNNGTANVAKVGYDIEDDEDHGAEEIPSKVSLIRKEHKETGFKGVALRNLMVKRYGKRFANDGLQQFYPGTFKKRKAKKIKAKQPKSRPTATSKQWKISVDSSPVDMSYQPCQLPFCPNCGTNLAIYAKALQLAKEVG